jgi:D-alanine-D-alanine ligase
MEAEVAVLYGGISRERSVSLKSGANIISSLENLGYKTVPFDLTLSNIRDMEDLRKCDLVFNMLHGRFGEDGCVQGYMELLGINYTGSDTHSSAVCFNKETTYRLLANSVRLPAWKAFGSVEEAESWEFFPAVVKPVSEGSSIGIEICDDPGILKEAVTRTLKTYGRVLVEEYVRGTEVTVSVLTKNGAPVVLPVLEIRPKKRFYDYEAKYTAGLTDFMAPAELNKDALEELETMSKMIFKELDCRDLARIDGIIRDGVFFFLEVNTIPGMTDLSDLPLSARAQGMTFEDVTQWIVEEAGLRKQR